MASGVAGSVFAILGLIGPAILFLPFAALFLLVALLRVASSPNAAGLVAAASCLILTVIALVVSPTFWVSALAILGASR
jgi:hypothetical protein